MSEYSQSPKPLSKAQLISALSAQLNKPQKEIKEFIEAYNQIAYSETRSKGKFTLPGIGILKTQQRMAQIRRVPGTDRKVEVPAQKTVKIKTAKALQDAIAEKPK